MRRKPGAEKIEIANKEIESIKASEAALTKDKDSYKSKLNQQESALQSRDKQIATLQSEVDNQKNPG